MLPNLALAALSFAAIGRASTLQVNNHCAHPIWLSLTNPKVPYPEPIKVDSGEAFAGGENVGEGNSVGVSFSEKYYSENTPKFVLGYSVSGGRLWWSHGKASGDLFDGKHFNITTPDRDGRDVCGSTTTYDQENQNCLDGSFTLTFNPCFE